MTNCHDSVQTAAIQIRRDIVNYGRELLEKGLVSGTWGNISARVDTNLMAITPSGRDYLSLSPDDIVLVDIKSGGAIANQKPSSELELHLAIYRARSDIAAIVHTHSVFASSCAVARKPIPPIIEDLVQAVGGSVAVADYALPGTPKLAENVVKALDQKRAALMANHGVVGCGGNLKEALTICELVEKAAQILIYANMLGGSHILSDEDVDCMHKFYNEHYRKRQGGQTDE